MHYFELGEGRPVIFFHGNPVWSYLWRNVLPLVENAGRCIAFDLIGMGRSGKPDIDYSFLDHSRYIEAFIENLGLKDVILVLHDWGMALGMYYTMHRPKNVTAIAYTANGMNGLIEGVLSPLKGWNEIDKQVGDMLQSFRTPELGWKLVAEQNMFIDQVLLHGALRGIGPEQIAYYNEPYKTPQDRKAVWAWPQQIPVAGDPAENTKAIAEVNKFLQETTIPKLFIHGQASQENNGLPMVKWFMEHVKNIEFRSVGPVGHYLQEDNPEGIGVELAKWIKGLNHK
jgi:haloalkane dehalogenase